MRTMHLLLGNSDRLLTNFIEVLVQDACAERGVVQTTSVRTVEAMILEGLTGRFDLGIIIPKNLVPDGTSTRIYNAYSEAGQGIRILKKRCSMPIVAAAAVEERSVEAQILWDSGVDAVVGLPFHPAQFCSTILEVVNRKEHKEVRKRPRVSRMFLEGLATLGRRLPARATSEGIP